MNSCTIYFIPAFFLLHLSRCDILCNEAYECQSLSITSSSGDDIECAGDHSCSDGAIINVNSSNGNILCQGAYSCFGAASIIQSDVSDGGDIYCGGLYSCAKIPTILNAEESIWCYGELGCFSSEIYVLEDTGNNSLPCFGGRSCANTITHISGSSLMYGFLASMNGILSNYNVLNDIDSNRTNISNMGMDYDYYNYDIWEFK